MEFDVMTRATTWDNVATLARRTEAAGFSGMLFTEGHQVPWMNIAAAALAAPSLHFSTGIAIAFARSPMVTAEIAWELAQNTRGKFRLGLGSQVKAHITRRYGSPFDKPAPQMKDYVQAVKACLRAFRREGPLQHDGPYYKLSLLTEQWTPPRHGFEDVKVDISAVGSDHGPGGGRGRRRRARPSHAFDALHQEPPGARPGRGRGAGRARSREHRQDHPGHRRGGRHAGRAGAADQGSQDHHRLLRRHAELRLPVRRSRPRRPARPAQRLPQGRRQRQERGADHRRDPRASSPSWRAGTTSPTA